MIEIEVATNEDKMDVFSRIRQYDKDELARFFIKEHTLIPLLGHCPGFVVKLDGEKVAIMGVIEGKKTVQVYFYGTDVVNEQPILLTRFAKSFMQHVKSKYWGWQILVNKTQQQADAVRWLEYIGFRRLPQIGNNIFLEYVL